MHLESSNWHLLVMAPNGPEFTAKAVRDWLGRVHARTLFIERGSPCENGYCESFNGKLRDERLDCEIFHSLKEAQVLIERWRQTYNTTRPLSALGYRPPAPAAVPLPYAWTNVGIGTNAGGRSPERLTRIGSSRDPHPARRASVRLGSFQSGRMK